MKRSLLLLGMLLFAATSLQVSAQITPFRFTPSDDFSTRGTTITAYACPKNDNCTIKIIVAPDYTTSPTGCIVKAEYDLVIAPKKSKDLIWDLDVKAGEFRFNTDRTKAIKIDSTAFTYKNNADKKHTRTVNADEATPYPYGVNIDIMLGGSWVPCKELDPLIVSRD